MRLSYHLIACTILSLTILSSCQSENNKMQTKNEASSDRNDTHSSAQPDKAVSQHLSLDLVVDFESKTMEGSVLHKIENKGSNEIIFDTKGLKISKVEIDTRSEPVDFELAADKKFLGSALTVPIDEETKEVKIFYSTTSESSAVQWLNPIQTTDKIHPFLFTQGQAILTRTWIPCQDSPGIRVTYDAKLQVPEELMAVMSAENPKTKSADGVYNFRMEQAIPPYLIALAIGDLEFKAVGPRTGVYSEPSMLEKSHYEFGDMEKMLVSAEELYGPYLWDQYDVIVLPASFPFGGMENPRLTFATPTILAGDRSLTALIAHELAHSWSGNLVTNATWDDFWLNEGFTVYFERRIMEALYGVPYVKMLTQLGLQDLDGEIEDLGSHSHDTHLKLNLEGRDPDDGMTDIAYEKGALFLMALEEQVGRERFDQFLKKYFNDHKFQTLTTEEFIEYLQTNLIETDKVEIDLNAWIYGPGLPAKKPSVTSDRFSKVESFSANALKDKNWNKSKTKDWTTHEWLHFIRTLDEEIDLKDIQKIQEVFQFNTSGNSEILAAWLEFSINTGHYKEITNELEEFLVSVGRRKFLTPLYKALKNSDDLKLAKDIYTKARPNYHSVSQQTMDALLNE